MRQEGLQTGKSTSERRDRSTRTREREAISEDVAKAVHELTSELKARIDEMLSDPVVNETDAQMLQSLLDSLPEWEKGQQDGVRAGEYMRSLVLKSDIRPIKREAIERSVFDPSIRKYTLLIDTQIDETLLGNGYGVEDEAVIRKPTHVDADDDYIRKSAWFRSKIPGTGLTIIEAVSNVMPNNTGRGEQLISRSITHSELLVKTKDGRQLLLNDLLPMEQEIHLAPIVMHVSPSAHEVKDLDQYNGFVTMSAEHDDKSSDGIGARFSRLGVGESKIQTITYGNLAAPGGVLTLLHEMAHAWQEVHGHIHPASSGILALKAVVDAVSEFHTMMSGLPAIDENNDPQTEQNARSEKILEGYSVINKCLLAATGYEVSDFFTQNGKDILIGYDRPKKKLVPLDKDRLNALVKQAVLEERDAWAIAIRTLRFLRKQGYDLEPELQTLEDFAPLVYGPLATYQIALESIMMDEPEYSYIRFTNRFTQAAGDHSDSPEPTTS